MTTAIASGLVLVAFGVLVGLVVKYARSDAKGGQRVQVSEAAARAARIVAAGATSVRTKAEAKARAAVRRLRRDRSSRD